MTVTIRFTADIITPDDTDTNVYGEPTETGYGESLESGWWDPNFSLWLVFEDKESALEIEVVDDEDAIREEIEGVIGAIDHYDGTSAYAADPIRNHYTGVSVMPAAHVQR